MIRSDSQAYPELVHKAEHGKRPPIVVGNWVVHCPMLGLLGSNLGLYQVLDGPEYRKDAGHCVDELWTCDDGNKRSRFELTPIDVPAIVLEARAAAACVLAGMRVDQRDLDVCWIVTQRAAELAKSRPRPSADLAELVAASEALDSAIYARRDFVHSTLPNLFANLHMAGALARAELVGVVKFLMLLGKENDRDESQG